MVDHRKNVSELTFRALAPRQSERVHTRNVSLK